MALADEITNRLPEQRLIQLTNDSGGQTSVNTTVLNAAIADTQGHFRRVSGISPDYTQDWQMALFLQGVLAYLEFYKGVDIASAEAKLDKFDKAVYNTRQRANMEWTTNSQLDPSTQQANSRPDMDRRGELKNIALTPNLNAVRETIEE